MPCPSRTVILKNTTAPTRCRMPPVSVRRSTSSRRKASRVSSILKSGPRTGARARTARPSALTARWSRSATTMLTGSSPRRTPRSVWASRTSLPGFALPNVILGGGGADGAGITLSTQFTKNIGATLFWLRAENDNTDSATDYGKQYHYSDAMDFTGITLPLKFDGVKVTPWAMYGFVGRDSFENAGASGDQKKLLQGLLPLGVSNKTLTGNSLTDRHGDAWWAGFTTELKVLDPFRFALDATYGRVDLGEGLSTKGKKIDVKKLDHVRPCRVQDGIRHAGLTAWYSSGDDANVNNGSERLPTINPDVKVTSYGFDGTNFCRAQQVLGTSVDGTFGIVAHLKDISFFEDLSHTLRVAFYRGTNNTENVRQKMITKPSETVSSMYYMTTADKAWEVNVDSEYKIYKNLSLFLELGYIRMDLDSNVWKDYESKKNNFKGAVCVLYSF
ncbi:MAG: outer membrane homotrimeric porin [Bilophila wadsworthia]